MADRSGREHYDLPPKSRTDDSRKGDDKNQQIRKEIEELSRKGSMTPAEYIRLQEKYKENRPIVEEALRFNAEQMAKRKKAAAKFAKKFVESLAEGKKSFHELEEKLIAYKIKKNMTESQYEQFRKYVSEVLHDKGKHEIGSSFDYTNKSQINKLFGMRWSVDGGLRLEDDDHPILAKILAMEEATKSLYHNVFFQGLQYEDCAVQAMSGSYNREKHNASNHVHPVLAAMFLPKIDLFDFQILYSNFGTIVKLRNEGKDIFTEFDSLLYNSIRIDPNDAVCAINKPLQDILMRYEVQIQIQRTVLNLREGRYYESDSINSLLRSLDKCRNNLLDNTELIYSRDDGAVLRKIFSVFSLRPTIVQTNPASAFSQLYGNSVRTSYTAFNFTPRPVITIIPISMIVLHLPHSYSENDVPVSLESGLSNLLWVNEGGNVVVKEQSVIYSRKTTVFYVNRRQSSITLQTFANPLTFCHLPLTYTDLEKVNRYPLQVNQAITIRNEIFELRSVVAVTELEASLGGREIRTITGSTTLIMQHPNECRNRFTPTYWLYDPVGASLPRRREDTGEYYVNKPITTIEGVFSMKDKYDHHHMSFIDRASQYGTIYFYAKPTPLTSKESGTFIGM